MGDITIKVRGVQIGMISAQGRYLDKQALLRLPKSERIAVYLALVWPEARSASTIGRVCGLKRGDIAGHGRWLLQIGTIRRVSRGRYALVREEGRAA